MSRFQPPPTYALPVLVDERSQKAIFNPMWLKWFVDFSENLTATGAGTVNSVSVVTANGVSGAVATPTSTPAITLVLGNITPTSVTANGLFNKQSIAVGATLTLPAGHSMVVVGPYINAGTFVHNGTRMTL